MTSKICGAFHANKSGIRVSKKSDKEPVNDELRCGPRAAFSGAKFRSKTNSPSPKKKGYMMSKEWQVRVAIKTSKLTSGRTPKRSSVMGPV